MAHRFTCRFLKDWEHSDMTRTLFALALTATFAMVSTVVAQDLRQPVSVESTAFNYDYYAQPEAQPSPSDVPVAPPAGVGGGCDGCGGYGCYDYCDDYDPCDCCRWTLCDNSCRSWTVGGWISGGGTVANHKPAGGFLTPLAFNDRDQEFHLNQFWVYAEKTVDGSCCGWDIGGRADIMWGTDHRFTQAVGWELHDDGTPHLNSSNPNHLYGFAVPQLYAEVGNANASIIVGHYYTLIGYEVVPANGNFFYSHSYTMLYGEPFTHTGALARYAYNDRTQVYIGVNNKWDTVDATSDRASVLAGFTWESCDCRGSIAMFVTSGSEVSGAGARNGVRTMYSMVGTYWINPCLQYVIQHDNGWQDNEIAAGTKAEWYGINQYLFYTVNDCWKAGLRFEWFRDDDGVRVPTSTRGVAGDYYEVSLGANWTPNCNLVVRPELRYDWYDGADTPFIGASRDNMLTAAIDIIFIY